MTRFVGVAALIPLALLSASPASTAAPRTRRATCYPRHHSRTIRLTRTVRVFGTTYSGDIRYMTYACDLRKQRTMALDRGVLAPDWTTLAVNGRYVAFYRRPLDKYAEPCGGNAEVVDVSAHRVLYASPTDETYGPVSSPTSDYVISTEALVLGPTGAMAYISGVQHGCGGSAPRPYHADYYILRVVGPNGVAELDRGPELARNSLALAADGRTLYWMNAGEVRSGSLS